MPKGQTYETDILALLFNATSIANIAQNNATAPETSLGVALHTASPGETGTQLTNEAVYGSYARTDVARTSGGWTVGTSTVSPVANIDFIEATSGSETETDFSIGKASNNDLFYYGSISPTIAVSTGVTPRLTTATAITEE